MSDPSNLQNTTVSGENSSETKQNNDGSNNSSVSLNLSKRTYASPTLAKSSIVAPISTSGTSPLSPSRSIVPGLSSPRTALATALISDAVERDIQQTAAQPTRSRNSTPQTQNRSLAQDTRASPMTISLTQPSAFAQQLQQQSPQLQTRSPLAIQTTLQPPSRLQVPASPSNLQQSPALLSPGSAAPPSPSWSLSSDALTQASTAVTWMSDARELPRVAGGKNRGGNDGAGNSDKFENSSDFDPVSVSRMTYPSMMHGVEEEEAETPEIHDSELGELASKRHIVNPTPDSGGSDSCSSRVASVDGVPDEKVESKAPSKAETAHRRVDSRIITLGVFPEDQTVQIPDPEEHPNSPASDIAIVIKGGEVKPGDTLTALNTSTAANGVVVQDGATVGYSVGTAGPNVGTAGPASAAGQSSSSPGDGDVQTTVGAVDNVIGGVMGVADSATTGTTTTVGNSSQLPASVSGLSVEIANSPTNSTPQASITNANKTPTAAEVASAVSALLSAAPPQRRGSTSRSESINPEMNEGPGKEFAESGNSAIAQTSENLLSPISGNNSGIVHISSTSADARDHASMAVSPAPFTADIRTNDLPTAQANAAELQAASLHAGDAPAASGTLSSLPDLPTAITAAAALDTATATAATAAASPHASTSPANGQPPLSSGMPVTPTDGAAAAPNTITVTPADSDSPQHALVGNVTPSASALTAVAGAPVDHLARPPLPSTSHSRSHSMSPQTQLNSVPPMLQPAPSPHAGSLSSARRASLPNASSDELLGQYKHARDSLTPRGVAGVYEAVRTPRSGVVEPGLPLGSVRVEPIVEGPESGPRKGVVTFHNPDSVDLIDYPAKYHGVDIKSPAVEMEELLSANVYSMSLSELRGLTERVVEALKITQSELDVKQQQINEYETVFSQHGKDEAEEKTKLEKERKALLLREQQVLRAEKKQGELDERVKTLIVEKQESEETIKTLMREKDEAERKIQELEQEKQIFGKGFSGLGLEAESVDVRLHNTMIEERENTIKSLQDGVAKAEIRALTAEAALATMESELSIVRRQFVQLTSAHEELESKLENSDGAIREQLQQLQQAHAALQAEKQEMEKTMQQVQAQLASAQAESQGKAESSAKDREEKEEMQRRIAFLQEEVAGRDRDLDQLVALLQSQEQNGVSSATVIQDQANKVREQAVKIHELEEMIAASAATKTRHEQEVSVMINAVMLKDEEMKKVAAQRDGTQQRCETLEKEVEKMKVALEMQENMYQQLQEKSHQEKSDLESEYLSRCAELEHQLHDMEVENAQIDDAWHERDGQARMLLESMRDNIQQKEEEIIALLHDNESKTAQIAEMDNQLTALSNKEQELQQKLTKAQEYIAQLEKEVERREEELRRADADMDDLRRRRTGGSSDDQIAELEQVIAELEKVISKEKKAQASLIEDMQVMLRRKEENVRMHVEDLQRANAVLRENSEKLGSYVTKLQDYSAECERERDEWKGMYAKEQRAREEAEACQRDLNRELQELQRWAAANDAVIRAAQENKRSAELANELAEKLQRKITETTEEAALATNSAREAQHEYEKVLAQNQQLSMEMERLIRGHSHEKKVLLRDLEVLAQVKQLREQDKKEYLSERERMGVVVKRLERELQAKTMEVQQLTFSLTQQQQMQASLQEKATDIPKLHEQVHLLEARVKMQMQEQQTLAQRYQQAVELHSREKAMLLKEMQRKEEEKEKEKSLLTSVVRKSESRVREMEEVLAMMKRKMKEQEDRAALHALAVRG